MNLQIREFEQNIINFINQSPLPIEVKRLVMKDIFYQVDKMADEAINQEIQRIKMEQESQKENQEQNEEFEEVTE